jgi:hypothetical protein
VVHYLVVQLRGDGSSFPLRPAGGGFEFLFEFSSEYYKSHIAVLAPISSTQWYFVCLKIYSRAGTFSSLSIISAKRWSRLNHAPGSARCTVRTETLSFYIFYRGGLVFVVAWSRFTAILIRACFLT